VATAFAWFSAGRKLISSCIVGEREACGIVGRRNVLLTGMSYNHVAFHNYVDISASLSAWLLKIHALRIGLEGRKGRETRNRGAREISG
jgi:hypothetical protein